MGNASQLENEREPNDEFVCACDCFIRRARDDSHMCAAVVACVCPAHRNVYKRSGNTKSVDDMYVHTAEL